MNIRQALLSDIPQIQIVRHSVRENTLSDPALVTDADCAEYLTVRGKGWVCEAGVKLFEQPGPNLKTPKRRAEKFIFTKKQFKK